MKPSDAIPVHPDPRANHQHRRARGADEVGEHGADQQEGHVDPWGRLAFHLDVNAAADDIEGAHQRHEADVFLRRMGQCDAIVQSEAIVARSDRAQGQCHFWVVMLPESRSEHGAEGDAQEQDRKRQHHQRVRLCVSVSSGGEEGKHRRTPRSRALVSNPSATSLRVLHPSSLRSDGLVRLVPADARKAHRR